MKYWCICAQNNIGLFKLIFIEFAFSAIKQSEAHKNTISPHGLPAIVKEEPVGGSVASIKLKASKLCLWESFKFKGIITNFLSLIYQS